MAWQKLHRSLPTGAPAKLPSWDAARPLLDLGAYAQQRLQLALKSSDEELWPLTAPLRLNLGEHRWLSADREESYSDWLAWILQGMSGTAEILPLFALGHDGAGGTFGQVEKVCREVPGEHGRTDVEVWFDKGSLLLIEVKVQPTGRELPGQLKRYRDWADREQPSAHSLVLLGTEEPNHVIEPFLFTHWRALCRRLRRYANKLKRRDPMRAAGILIFCGAVEQNLLWLSAQSRYGRAIRTADHLRDWRLESER